MPILETLLELLAAVTPEQIAQSALGFDPPAEGEHIYGVVQWARTRALWALAHDLDAQSEMYAHSFRFDANTPEERDAFCRLSDKASVMREIARDLAWAEMREELDAWDSRIGLRANFTLVKGPHSTLDITAIPLPLDRILEEILKRRAQQREDDQPKRKPS